MLGCLWRRRYAWGRVEHDAGKFLPSFDRLWQMKIKVAVQETAVVRFEIVKLVVQPNFLNGVLILLVFRLNR